MAGVVTSLVLAGAGMLLHFYEFGELDISEDKTVFLRDQNFFYFLLHLFRGGEGLDRALWLMKLGIAILILTPYARVIFSVLYFLAVRDWKFTLIALFVLGLLTITLVLH